MRYSSARGAQVKCAPSSFRVPLFCAVTVFFWFSLYTYVSFLANHVESKVDSHAWTGVILSSYGFAQTVLRIPLGVLSDRVRSRKPFVVAGLFASTASALLLAFAESAPVLVLSRGLAGVAAATWVAFSVLFSSYFSPSDATRAISTITVFLNAGNTLGLFLGGRAAHFFGPSVAFALAAGAGMLGLILSRWIVDNFNGPSAKLTVAAFTRVAQNPVLILSSCLALVLQAVTFATIYGFTPVYAESLGATKESLANLALISSLPVIAGNYLAGKRLVPRIGDAATAAIGLVLLAVFTVAIPSTGTMASLYVTQAVAGFGRGIALPVLMGLAIKDLSDEVRATAMGVFQAVYGIGMVLGPIVAGIVGELADLDLSFVLMGAVALAASLACVVALGRVQSERSGLKSRLSG